MAQRRGPGWPGRHARPSACSLRARITLDDPTISATPIHLALTLACWFSECSVADRLWQLEHDSVSRLRRCWAGLSERGREFGRASPVRSPAGPPHRLRAAARRAGRRTHRVLDLQQLVFGLQLLDCRRELRRTGRVHAPAAGACVRSQEWVLSQGYPPPTPSQGILWFTSKTLGEESFPPSQFERLAPLLALFGMASVSH